MTSTEIINKNLRLTISEDSNGIHYGELRIESTDEVFNTKYVDNAAHKGRPYYQNVIWEDVFGNKIKYGDIVRRSYRDDELKIVDKINAIIKMSGKTYYAISKATGLTEGAFLSLSKPAKGLSPALSTIIIMLDSLGFELKIMKKDDH